MADSDVSTKLFDAVKAGDQSRLQDLLRDKATLSILDERDAEGFTALQDVYKRQAKNRLGLEHL